MPPDDPTHAAPSRPRATPEQRDPGQDDQPADDLDRTDRLGQEHRGHHHRERRDEELERRHPGRRRAVSRRPEDDDVGEAGGQRPRIEDREDDRPAEPGQSEQRAAPIPGAMNTVPATIAQVVVTQRRVRRRIRAPNTGQVRAQQAAATSVSRPPPIDAPISIRCPAATTIPTPANDTRCPDQLDRVGRVLPIAMATSAVITGVVAISRAESPAGSPCRADRPQDLVAAEPDDPEQRGPVRRSPRGSRSRPPVPAAGRPG